METLGPTELLIILAIALLLFGSSRLPKIARSLGEAAHEFRRGTDDDGTNDDALNDGGLNDGGLNDVAPSAEHDAPEKPGAENH
jgi:sec-independent protein translocase protein TatA